MSRTTRIAFLGAGNMAAAMVEGILRAEVSARVPPTDSGRPARLDAASGHTPEGIPAFEVICYTASGRSAQALAARTGIGVAPTLPQLLNGASVLIVAFKPQHLAAADPALADLTEGVLVLSVLAGKRLEALARVFPRARNIVRSMPNTPSRIGAGVTGWCSLQTLSADDRALVEAVLGSMGLALEIPETQMDALTAVSGSGPAYVFEFAAALREAGIGAGLPPDLAETLAVETLLGAARLLARKRLPPEKLRDEVTSPNGTTFAGLQRLAAGNFRATIADAVQAARARAGELARG